MAQRPTFPSPYLNAIDATDDNKFVCLINDRDVITDYVFTIQKYIKTTDKNNVTTTTFEEVYRYPEEGSNTELEPIYGGRGNDSYLIVTVLSEEGKLENGAEYKWKVSLTDSLGHTVESKEYYFTCIAKPTLEITSDDLKEEENVLKLKTANAIFIGKYTCTSPLIYHRFILSKDGEVIKDTGEVYSQYISFEYDMFMPGNYSLFLEAENEGKMKLETRIDFAVEYTSAPTNVAPECYVSSDENSVVVDFSKVMTIPGTYVPDTKYQQIDVTDSLKGVYIPKNTELYWQQRVGVSKGLDIDENLFAVQLMVNLPYGKQGKIIEISGDNNILVSFDGFNINYQYSNGVSDSISIGESNQYFFANIPSSESIADTEIYAYSFNSSDSYNFTNEYQFVFQNPMNMYWWLLTITPDGVTATKGVGVVV